MRHAASATQVRRIDLGQFLFFDPRLSQDGRVSCASCHTPEHAYTDARAVSVGVRGQRGTRNAPSLLDLQNTRDFFWDGRETDLRRLMLQPLVNPLEMGLPSAQAAVDIVAADARYMAAFAEAYGGRTPALSTETVADALRAFVLSLRAPPNTLDRWRGGDPAALDAAARRGMALFVGRAGCAQCHTLDDRSARLTDDAFHHAGIGFEHVAGRLSGILAELTNLRRTEAGTGALVLRRRDIAELGRYVATRRPVDLGAFRTPSLRNVAITAPYMHDGSVATLEAAVDREIYYRSLALGHPIALTVEEKRQLLAFLRALTANAEPATAATRTRIGP